ncbi:MAG TPA: hypothetical protein VE733_17695 [Streptosporangiaceae bacterium]|jgi:hypothetical protein|nr:hypothetical protein [Streptosporangiaceae bacterium]
MTGFTLPPLVVDYDARWIDVDLRGDLGEWARKTAQDMLARSPGRHRGRDEKSLAALLETAGAMARQADDASIALLLYPSHQDGLKALVRFCPVDLAGREGEDAWDALLASLPAGEPPEVTKIGTAAGPCRRVRQPYAAGEESGSPVGERLGYIWVFPQYGAGVIMTTSFVDAMEAGRWRPALDALAAAAALEPAEEEVRPG